jgi:hypothetical protein
MKEKICGFVESFNVVNRWLLNSDKGKGIWWSLQFWLKWKEWVLQQKIKLEYFLCTIVKLPVPSLLWKVVIIVAHSLPQVISVWRVAECARRIRVTCFKINITNNSTTQLFMKHTPKGLDVTYLSWHLV